MNKRSDLSNVALGFGPSRRSGDPDPNSVPLTRAGESFDNFWDYFQEGRTKSEYAL
jgi:hypothetical protein